MRRGAATRPPRRIWGEADGCGMREDVSVATALLAAMGRASVLILLFGKVADELYEANVSRGTWGDARFWGRCSSAATTVNLPRGLAVAVAFHAGPLQIGLRGAAPRRVRATAWRPRDARGTANCRSPSPSRQRPAPSRRAHVPIPVALKARFGPRTRSSRPSSSTSIVARPWAVRAGRRWFFVEQGRCPARERRPGASAHAGGLSERHRGRRGPLLHGRAAAAAAPGS